MNQNVAGFKIIKPGFLSLLQDYGRFGLQKYGLSPSGALDEQAYRWGNHLLDNSQNCASLEIMWGNCQLLATIDTVISVTGADLEFSINTHKVPIWQTHVIKQGDLLTFGKSQSGIRAYLSVSGGFQTETFFNSRSVSLRENIGYPLKTNDTLACLKKSNSKSNLKATPKEFIPNYDQPLNLRLLETFQSKEFNDAQHQQFFDQTYSISQQADRTAYQLQGQAVTNVPNNMISQAMTAGAVQITQAGQPIIMMKEHPTIGGYPKIGTVLSIDCAKLAQRASGDSIRFIPISYNQARKEQQTFLGFFN